MNDDNQDDDFQPLSDPSGSPSSSSSSSSSSSEDDPDSSDDEFVPMQDHPIQEDANDPLYDGAPLTRIQSYLMIHQHLNQFQTSRVEKEFLLKLIKAHCPAVNQCFSSLAEYENFLSNGGSHIDLCHRGGSRFCFEEQQVDERRPTRSRQ